jgi:hypothetical protein
MRDVDAERVRAANFGRNGGTETSDGWARFYVGGSRVTSGISHLVSESRPHPLESSDLI